MSVVAIGTGTTPTPDAIADRASLRGGRGTRPGGTGVGAGSVLGDIIYEFSDLDELVLAYACSIHKSQGSEYPCVVIPVHTQHYMMLQRNLLYSGITRGKRLVVLVGSKRALAIAVKNNKVESRCTLFTERLAGGAAKMIGAEVET